MIHIILFYGIILALLDYPFLSHINTVYQPMITKITGSPLTIDTSSSRTILIVLIAYILMGLAMKELVYDYRSATVVGLTMYGVYSMTNMLLFKQWPWSTAIKETLWGATLYTIAYFVIKQLNFL